MKITVNKNYIYQLSETRFLRITSLYEKVSIGDLNQNFNKNNEENILPGKLAELAKLNAAIAKTTIV